MFAAGIENATRAQLLRLLPLADVLERARRGECLLWIRNTVDQAQETYRAIRAAATDTRVGLLHSRFPHFRREQLETEWMDSLGKDSAKRPSGCILISTQIAEQSVDIDADLLISDLAPTDMLLQRLGRLWRHDRRSRPCPRPEVWIQMAAGTDLRRSCGQELRDALGKSARVYAPYVLLRSWEQWHTRNSITLPEEIRAILEATYSDPDPGEPAAWRDLREELEKQKHGLAGLALNATAIWNNPSLPDEEGVQTRYNTYPQTQVLLLRQFVSIDAHSAQLQLLNGDTATIDDREWSFASAKAIHRNLVRIPRWLVAIREGVSSPDYLIQYIRQSNGIGLVASDGVLRWLHQKEPSGLTYDAEQGIVIDRDANGHALNEEFNESYD